MPKKKNKIDKDLKKIVIARLGILPSDKKISMGSSGEFTKKEMIKHVEKEDPIGEKIVKVHLDYLQSLKEGIFYEQEAPSYEAET